MIDTQDDGQEDHAGGDAASGPQETAKPDAKHPTMARYVNANRKLVVYTTLAFRMRDGASADRVRATIARMDQGQIPPEGRDIADFAARLAERLADALKRPDAANQAHADEPGLVFMVAQEVFGPESLSFVEQISLDVATSEMMAEAVRTGDPERAMNRIAADIMRATAEALRASIDTRK